VLRGLAVAGWVVFAFLAAHRSVSPEYLGRYSREYVVFLGLVLLVVVSVSVAATRGPRRRPPLLARNAAATAALLAGSVAFALLAGEGLVRSLDLLGVSFFEEVTRYIHDLQADETLAYRHRARLSTTYQGVAFRTNELGLRDRPLPEAGADLVRVLVLGDSVTLGWGVPVEATFAARLEPALEARLGRRVRTINAGVSGYNTEQELAFYRQHARRLAPDLVVLLYVENDVEPAATNFVDIRERWENPPGASAFLLRWSWLYRLMHRLLPDVLGTAGAPAHGDGRERSMRALRELSRFARGEGAELVVFLYRLTPDEATDALRAEIGALAAAEAFPFFDTLPWFEGVLVRSVINSFSDTHPNAEGHRLVAEGIASALEASGVLDRLASLPDAGRARPGAPGPLGGRASLAPAPAP
jgi:lysophospholipase L1-like esterase